MSRGCQTQIKTRLDRFKDLFNEFKSKMNHPSFLQLSSTFYKGKQHTKSIGFFKRTLLDLDSFALKQIHSNNKSLSAVQNRLCGNPPHEAGPGEGRCTRTCPTCEYTKPYHLHLERLLLWFKRMRPRLRSLCRITIMKRLISGQLQIKTC